MKKAMIAFVGLASASSVLCHAQTGGTEVIAHRGFWQTDPPVAHNSIASLENAAGLGCWGTEFDVHVTADGVPVVFHDQHTADGVDLQAVSYSDITALNSTLPPGEAIPSSSTNIEEWKRTGKKVRLVLEIKDHNSPERDRWAVEKVLAAVRKNEVAPDEVDYIAFSKDVCRALYDQRCGSPIAYLSGNLTPAQAREQLGADGIDYHMNVLRNNPGWIAEAHALGMTVNVWTVDRPEDLQHFIDAGVDYITTDRPDLLMKMLGK